MKFWIRLLLLTVADYAIIWLLIRLQDPDPSVSIAILMLVPFVIIVNLIIAGILFRKQSTSKRQYAKLFLINSFISAVLMYMLFAQGISRHMRQRYTSWKFQLNDTTYTIDFYKPDTTFSISYSTHPGSSSGFIYGHVQYTDSQYLLSNDTIKLLIRNNRLSGFRSNVESLELKPIDH